MYCRETASTGGRHSQVHSLISPGHPTTLLQTTSIINKLNITNTTIITIASIDIYIYLVRKLTILIVVSIKYNV